MCIFRIRPLQAPWCGTCGRPLDPPAPAGHCGRCLTAPPPFRRARSWAYYSSGGTERNPLARALWTLKYGRRADLGRRLGNMLVTQTCFRAGEHDLLIPVPLHRDRLRWRGFNHSYLLAAPLARRLSLPLAPTALCRKRATRPQVSLPETARLSNVRDAFSVPDHRRVAGRRVLLVDDVFTTGATVAACATALDRAGATAVDVLTLARAVP